MEALAPKLSVLIPSYNRRHLLPKALESIRAQNLDLYEILVVDDGSSDDTQSYLEQQSAQDPHLRYIVHPQNKGEAAARNTAIQNARGEWLAFLDSDDYWLEGKIDRQLKLFLQSDGTLDAVITNVWILTDQDKYLGGGWHQNEPITKENLLLKGCALNLNNTILFRRSVALKAGPYNERLKLFVDVDWFLRFLEHGIVKFLDEPLAVYNKAPARSGEAVQAAAIDFLQQNKSQIEAMGAKLSRQTKAAFFWTAADAYYHEKDFWNFIRLAFCSLSLRPLGETYRHKSFLAGTLRKLTGRFGR